MHNLLADFYVINGEKDSGIGESQGLDFLCDAINLIPSEWLPNECLTPLKKIAIVARQLNMAQQLNWEKAAQDCLCCMHFAMVGLEIWPAFAECCQQLVQRSLRCIVLDISPFNMLNSFKFFCYTFRPSTCRIPQQSSTHSRAKCVTQSHTSVFSQIIPYCHIFNT